MELLDISVLLPRYIFVIMGWIIFASLRLWAIKNTIDEINTSSKRKIAWREYKRKHIEDYIISLIIGLILSTALNALVIIIDKIKDTDYNHIITSAYADLGACFLIGLFSLSIAKKIRSKGENEIDKL
jgi:hypothetical protein